MTEITTYTVDELDWWAQDRAYAIWRSDREYGWTRENATTLAAFTDHFPVRVTDWSYGMGSSDIEWEYTGDPAVGALRGIRLAAHLWNRYRPVLYRSKVYWGPTGKQRYSRIRLERDPYGLTGYYLDGVILGPIYRFLDHPDPTTDFVTLLGDCLWAWVAECQRDLEATYSWETFLQECRDFGYRFSADGEVCYGL